MDANRIVKLTTNFFLDLSLVIKICGHRSMRRYNRPANDTERSQAWRGSPPYPIILNHPRRLHHRQRQLSYYSINIPVTPIHRASYAFTGWLQSTSSLGTRSPYRASLRSRRCISYRRHHRLINTRWLPVYRDRPCGRNRPTAVALRGSIPEMSEIYLKFS